jgi:hypothetical protein
MTLTHELVLRNGHRTEISDSMLRYFIHQLAEHSRADNIAWTEFRIAAADVQLRQLEQVVEHGAPEVGAITARYA